MAESTALSPCSVLPNELLIEILSRVDSINPLELRCVCKLWNSLVLHPVFVWNHLFRSLTYFNDVTRNTREHFIACKSLLLNNPPEPQEEDEDEDDGDNDEDDDDDDDDGDDEEEEEDDDDDDHDDDDDGDDEEEEEGDDDEGVVEEELARRGEGDEEEADEEEVEEEEEKEFMMSFLVERDNLDEEEVEQWVINIAAKIISYFKDIGYIKNFRPLVKYLEDIEISNENLEAMKVDLESMEVRVKCLESFLRIYLKCGSISSR